MKRLLTILLVTCSSVFSQPELTNTEATNVDNATERQAWRQALDMWTDDNVTLGSLTLGTTLNVDTIYDAAGNTTPLLSLTNGTLGEYNPHRLNFNDGTLEVYDGSVFIPSIDYGQYKIYDNTYTELLDWSAGISLTGTPTIAGDFYVSGQVEATGQSADTDDSLMTRSLGDARYRKQYAFDYPMGTWHNLATNGTTATAVLRTATSPASITNPNSTASDWSKLRPVNRAGQIFVRALSYNAAYANRRSMIVDFIPRTTSGSSSDTTWLYMGLDTSINDLTDTANLWGSNVHGYGCTITNVSGGLYAKIAFHANSTAGVQTASTTYNLYAANPQKCYRLVMTEVVYSNNNTNYEVELYDMTLTSTGSPTVDPVWSESIGVTSANKTTGNSALNWYGPVARSWSDNTDGNTMALSLRDIWIK